MDSDSIDRLEFCDYDLVISRLQDHLGWSPWRARVEVFDAVRSRRLRLESDPNPPPDFNRLHDQHLTATLSTGVVARLLNPAPPPWKLERYSVSDLNAMVKAHATPGSGKTADRKGIGGPKGKYPWEELAAGYAAWRLGERHDPDKAQMRAGVEEVARRLGVEIPDRRRVGEKVERWEQAYKAVTKHDD